MVVLREKKRKTKKRKQDGFFIFFMLNQAEAEAFSFSSAAPEERLGPRPEVHGVVLGQPRRVGA